MRNLLAAVAAATLIAGAAVAQTPSPMSSSKAPVATAKPVRVPVVRTAKSLDCSKQADTKGLHGKPRKSFMSGCKKS